MSLREVGHFGCYFDRMTVAGAATQFHDGRIRTRGSRYSVTMMMHWRMKRAGMRRGASWMLKVTLVVASSFFVGCADPDSVDAVDQSDAGTGGALGKADGLGGGDWPILDAGDSNRAVVTAQYLLRHHSMSLSLNGLFDAQTEDAVIDFQAREALVVDGVIGPATWGALIELVGPGDAGNAVRAVQDQLSRQHGFDLTISGDFTSSTEQAVADFQEDHCLEVDGWVGPQTWNALVTDRRQCSGGSSGSFGADRLLELHDSGRITLWNRDFGRGSNGADALSNVEDSANGRSSRCSPGAPCGSVGLDGLMLEAMVGLADERGFDYFVTSIAGGFHSSGSFHYAGRAFDVDEVNGTLIRGDSSVARAFMSACWSLGAVEVLGPSNDPAGHFDHIHCAF